VEIQKKEDETMLKGFPLGAY